VRPPVSRRDFIAGSAAAAGLAVLGGGTAQAADGTTLLNRSPLLRQPDSRPDPKRPAGTPDPRIPIDHVVVLMMENHSFDNYFGMLPKLGQPKADGFRFNQHGKPVDTQPTKGGVIRAFKMPSVCQMEHEPDQSWNGTHIAMNHGRMNGFVKASGDVAMGYWDNEDLPFYYSLANHFTLANRWFCSAPCQTYPNRRYLMAGTSYGLVASVIPGVNDPPPPNGTIFDRLNAHGISWKNYFTDLPQTALIPSVAKGNATRLAPVATFFSDCAAGTLPAVSYVDPDFGLADVIGGLVPGQPVPEKVRAQGADEENPQNIRIGAAFAASVVNAVLDSPAWKRTLLIWFYDEHGGYYDHVPPPVAIAPDKIKPDIEKPDFQAGFTRYGPRVPAVVASPYSKPHGVTNVVHDHTSVLAFIEQKWNLPALTHRDANAHSLLDFLDLSKPRLLDPPALAKPADPTTADLACYTKDPHRPVQKRHHKKHHQHHHKGPHAMPAIAAIAAAEAARAARVRAGGQAG
jgi:phospholipase C